MSEDNKEEIHSMPGNPLTMNTRQLALTLLSGKLFYEDEEEEDLFNAAKYRYINDNENHCCWIKIDDKKLFYEERWQSWESLRKKYPKDKFMHKLLDLCELSKVEIIKIYEAVKKQSQINPLPNFPLGAVDYHITYYPNLLKRAYDRALLSNSDRVIDFHIIDYVTVKKGE